MNSWSKVWSLPNSEISGRGMGSLVVHLTASTGYKSEKMLASGFQHHSTQRDNKNSKFILDYLLKYKPKHITVNPGQHKQDQQKCSFTQQYQICFRTVLDMRTSSDLSALFCLESIIATWDRKI